MSKGKETPTGGNKRRRIGPQISKTDMFTALCESMLHVECQKEYRFHPRRMWRFDYAIPEYRVALEVEGGVWTGGRHTRPGGYLGDMEKYNTAAMFGWVVVRTTPKDLCTGRTLDMLKTVMAGRCKYGYIVEKDRDK